MAFGGRGNDLISLGIGDDHGVGEEGDDTLLGGARHDIIDGDIAESAAVLALTAPHQHVFVQRKT